MKRLIETTLDGEAGSILSDCEQYRYRLWRTWDRAPPSLGFIMLNPSTADHQVNDPTITRCLQRALGARKFGGLEVVNLFPLRSTDPDGLLTHAAPLGDRSSRNDGAIMDAIDRCSMVICAWGAHKAAPERALEVLHIVRMCGRGNRCMADLKQLYKWCIVREIVTTDPMFGLVKRDIGGKEELGLPRSARRFATELPIDKL